MKKYILYCIITQQLFKAFSNKKVGDYMSNIIKNSETLSMLVDDIKYIEKHGISKSFIEEILRQMTPTINNQPLIRYFVTDSKYDEGSVSFVPSDETIEIYLGKLNYWLENCIEVLINDYNLSGIDTLKGYQLMHIIAHEVEHAYQYLMGKGLIAAPNSVIADAYRGLFDLILSDDNSEAKKIYFADFKKLLLERNAQVESIDLILQCSKYSGRTDIYNAYKSIIWGQWIMNGYKDNNNGSICETYQLLGLYDRSFKFYHELPMSDEERIRYGFPISDDAYQKVLKKIK